MGRKVVYNLIYIGVALAFPDLPLNGLKFIAGIFRGTTEALAEEGKREAKEQLGEWKEDLFKSLNPFE